MKPEISWRLFQDGNNSVSLPVTLFLRLIRLTIGLFCFEIAVSFVSVYLFNKYAV
jgi:hypothetical protein